MARDVIVIALRAFDPQLGRRAADILYNPDRLNIVESIEPRTGMMQCRPAGLSLDDLKSRDMYLEGFAEHFGPDFTEQDNRRDYAVIDYEYTYTKTSVLDLAHEVGHAIADDMQRERGHSHRDFSLDEMEEQAYFVQSIVADKVSPDFNKDSSAFDTTLHVAGAFNRLSQRLSAQTAFEKAERLPPIERNAFITQLLGGASIQQPCNVERKPAPALA